MNKRPTLGWAITLGGLLLTAVSIGAPLSQDVERTVSKSVTIINTGDRFVAGYRITVSPEGKLSSASLSPRGAEALRHTDQMIPPIRRRFFRDLARATPLDKLPAGGRAAATGRRRRPSAALPVSGVQVFVVSEGHQSPNLRLAGSDAGKALYQDVKHIMSVLQLPIPNTP